MSVAAEEQPAGNGGQHEVKKRTLRSA